MPLMPWKSCPVAGCPELVRFGRCERHDRRQKKAQAERRHNEPFYNKMRWQRRRNAKRTRDPLCERCLRYGRTRVADMVHHIKPISEGGSKLDWNNLMCICFGCHVEVHRK